MDTRVNEKTPLLNVDEVHIPIKPTIFDEYKTSLNMLRAAKWRQRVRYYLPVAIEILLGLGALATIIYCSIREAHAEDGRGMHANVLQDYRNTLVYNHSQAIGNCGQYHNLTNVCNASDNFGNNSTPYVIWRIAQDCYWKAHYLCKYDFNGGLEAGLISGITFASLTFLAVLFFIYWSLSIGCSKNKISNLKADELQQLNTFAAKINLVIDDNSYVSDILLFVKHQLASLSNVECNEINALHKKYVQDDVKGTKKQLIDLSEPERLMLRGLIERANLQTLATEKLSTVLSDLNSKIDYIEARRNAFLDGFQSKYPRASNYRLFHGYFSANGKPIPGDGDRKLTEKILTYANLPMPEHIDIRFFRPIKDIAKKKNHERSSRLSLLAQA